MPSTSHSIKQRTFSFCAQALGILAFISLLMVNTELVMQSYVPAVFAILLISGSLSIFTYIMLHILFTRKAR